jgi:rubrerythrin
MNPDHVQKLWYLRFLKVLELEEESFEFYKKLIEERSTLLEAAGIKSTLKQIMQDEGRHIRIARDLIRFVQPKE